MQVGTEQMTMKLSEQKSKRIGFIDALKGTGILFVVIGHVAQSYLDSGMLTEAKGLLSFMFNAAYCFHMPFFFMISGFMFFRAYFDGEGRAKYGKLRLQLGNLLWVYVLFSVVYGIYRIVFARYANADTTASDILLIGIKPLGVFWYLHALILLYLIFMIPRVARQQAWLLLTVSGMLCMLSAFTAGIAFLDVICGYAFYFCLGIVLDRTGKSLSPYVLILTALAAVLLILYRGKVSGISSVKPVEMIVALGISFGLWFLFERWSILGENDFLKLLGRHSMEIYVIHTFSTSGCRGLLPLLGIREAYISILLNFAISMTLPFLFVWITNSLHIYNFFFRPMRLFGKGKGI